MNARSLYQRVLIEAYLSDLAIARRATGAVLHALRDRLTPEEADQAVAQLPTDLKVLWRAGQPGERRPVKMRRPEFYERVRKEADLPSTREARAVTGAVFAALKEQLSPGEADDIVAQLPRDLKEVWQAA